MRSDRVEAGPRSGRLRGCRIMRRTQVVLLPDWSVAPPPTRAPCPPAKWKGSS